MCVQGNARVSLFTGSVQLAKIQRELEHGTVVLNAKDLLIFIASVAGDGFAAHSCLPTEKMERMGRMIQDILRLLIKESIMEKMRKFVQSFLAGTKAIRLHWIWMGLLHVDGAILTTMLVP